MSFSAVLRLLRRHWLLLLLVPLVLGASTYFFTRHEKKSFLSETTIYTGAASGYSIEGNADPNFFAANNASDNLLTLLNSRDTKEEAILRLLATHLMLPAPNPAVLGAPGWQHLREVVPANVRPQLVGPTLDSTQHCVARYARANDHNPLTQLLNSTDPTYSLTALGRVTAARVGASDLLKVSYEADDPAVARQTLALLVEVFMERNKGLRSGQTSSVIRYYDTATRRAKQRLDSAERRFLAFSRANRLVNFDEQTKDIATAKEALDAEYNQVDMQYAGAVSALQAVTKRLAGRGAALRGSSQLLEQRQQLGRLNAQIADQELFARQSENGAAATRLAQLRAEAEAAARAIQASVSSYYEQTTSVDGIPTKTLLDDWVKNTVQVEENKARLAVMARHRASFEQEYARLAPLGATLKGIEREIALAEKDYLALLGKLNESQASQENNQMMPNLRVVDPPFLPGQPKGSKRLLLVLLGAVGGFVCTAAGVLAVGLLDKTLRAPGPAALRTELPIGGVWPDAVGSKAVPPAYLDRAAAYLARHVLLQAAATTHPAPVVVGVLSMRRQQGKTTICEALADHCSALGFTTLALYPHAEPAGTAATISPGLSQLCYPAEKAAVLGWSLAELTQGAAEVPQLILLEMPSLLEDTYPVALLPHLDFVLLTAQASATWPHAEQQTVADLRAATTAPIELVLVGVAPDECEELLGKLPKTSSKLPTA
jgi:succinoglycan biosynthesis transport protein ExoP